MVQELYPMEITLCAAKEVEEGAIVLAASEDGQDGRGAQSACRRTPEPEQATRQFVLGAATPSPPSQ